MKQIVKKWKEQEPNNQYLDRISIEEAATVNCEKVKIFSFEQIKELEQKIGKFMAKKLKGRETKSPSFLIREIFFRSSFNSRRTNFYH